MFEKKKQHIFYEEIYDTEISLDVNAGVLERIYNSNVIPGTKLEISGRIDHSISLKPDQHWSWLSA